MQALRLEQIAAMCGGKLTQGNAKALALRVCTHSREARPGDCFIALAGERFDAHKFLPDVERAGATVAIVRSGEKSAELARSESKVSVSVTLAAHYHPTNVANVRNSDLKALNRIALIEVEDTVLALHRFATAYRQMMKIKVVAVTGSCGKTTTKELIAAVLSQKFSVIKSHANHNNHIGVPLSILNISEEHEVGVFEAGTNHPGEIAALAAILKPDVAVITNVGCAHLEHFGSREAIAKEKGMLVEALGKDGVAVLNADNEWTLSIARRCQGSVFTVGMKHVARLRATAARGHNDIQFAMSEHKKKNEGGNGLCTATTKREVSLPLLGRHQIYNVLQAAAVGRVFSMEFEEILEGIKHAALPEMRMQQENSGGILIFNDAYNANPDSMLAALAAFRHVKADGRRVAVLGEMLELGDGAVAEHQNIGRIVAQKAHIKLLVTVGALARHIGEAAKSEGLDAKRVIHFDTAEQAAAFLKMDTRRGDCVLLKASRKIGLECVAEALRESGRDIENDLSEKEFEKNRLESNLAEARA